MQILPGSKWKNKYYDATLEALHIHSWTDKDGRARKHVFAVVLEGDGGQSCESISAGLLLSSWTEIKPFFEKGKTYRLRGDSKSFKITDLHRTSDGGRRYAVAEWSLLGTGDCLVLLGATDFEEAQEVSS